MLQANEIYVGAQVCVLFQGKPFCNTVISEIRPSRFKTIVDDNGKEKKVQEILIFVKGNEGNYGEQPVTAIDLIPFHRAWREIKFSGGVPIKGIIA